MMTAVILIVVLLDVSGSMAMGSRIEALNSTMRTLLSLLSSAAADRGPAPVWLAIGVFAAEPMWIVDEPTPPEEIPWADLQPWSGQRADFECALAEADRLITQLDGGFESAVVVVVTDTVAATATPPSSALDRVQTLTVLVDDIARDGAREVVALATGLLD